MKNIILVFLLGFSLSSCDRRNISSDPLDQGIQKIDSGEYTAAIDFLQDLSTRDSRPEVKIALATAYVGRAGVKIEDYWELVRQLKKEPISLDAVQTNSYYLENKKRVEPILPLLSGRVQQDLDTLFRSVAAFDLYRERIEYLPYVSESNRADLQNGIDVLTDISTAGGRFYRAVLLSTQLRSVLSDGFDVWASIESRIRRALTYPLEAPLIFCSPLTGDFVNWLLIRFNNTAALAEDISYAFPSDAEDLLVFEESVSELQDQIPAAQRSLVPRGCP